jgi:hypothetical protein
MSTPSTPELVALHIVLPRTWEDNAVDWLLSQPQTYVEFTLQAVASHAAAARSRHVHELVQGFSEGICLHILTTRGQLATLLADMKTTLRGADGRWWVSPVEAFGRLDEESA